MSDNIKALSKLGLGALALYAIIIVKVIAITALFGLFQS